MTNHSRRNAGRVALTLFLFLACILSPVSAEGKTITFNTLGSGYYYTEGMPMFDGNPAHLDAYVNAYLDWVGLEGACVYAAGLRDSYKLTTGTQAGAIIPGGLAAADNVQGISTDFPALVGWGQTWNKDLVAEIGDVMGSEKMSTLLTQLTIARNNHNGKDSSGSGSYSKSATIAFTAIHDMRINPLSGRIDESVAEDPYLVGTMINSMATGFTGLKDGQAGTVGTSDDGFYTRGIVGTKHFSVYNAQWYRQAGSQNAGARAILEYQIQSALKGLSSGAIAGVMSSYGRTNGVPNEISSYNFVAEKASKYGMYASPDFNGENYMYTANAYGNGYDTQYVSDRQHALALMVLAGIESVRAMGTDKTDALALYNAVQNGIFGVTESDVRAAAKPLLKQMVRAGLFDEVDSSGYPKFYPYVKQSKDGAASTDLTDYNTASHQAVALKAAQESIVLLKNANNALPLASGKKLAVAGVLADSRFKTTYAVSTTPSITDSGLSPLLGIIKRYGTGADSNITFDLSARIVAIKASNGKYLTAQSGTGGNLTADFTYDASTNPFTDAQLFEVFDWGQKAFSIRSKLNGYWLTAPSAASTAVGNTNSTALNLTNSDWDLATSTGTTSSIPPRLQLQDSGDGTFAIVSNAYSTGFGGGYETQYWSARFYTLSESDSLIKTAADTMTTVSGTPSSLQKFTLTETESLSADIVARAGAADYAILVVGAMPRNSAGEGADRNTLAMGDADYKLVKDAAAAFAAKGKKTIVVLKTSFPVLMKEIQDNRNVAAIIYQPYAGQYDGKALAQALFGDFSPSGRLTNTWYASDDVLEAISSYSIPEGTSKTLSQIDPRLVKDMTNADPQAAGLTYMYSDPSNVTYEFGYGLSYANFRYGRYKAPARAWADKTFTVSVAVTNAGRVASSEVVQLYMRQQKSAYGWYAPAKKLVSFEKVALEPGQTKTVSLTVDPKDMAVWDVNKGDFVVEGGKYDIMVGSSSEKILCDSDIDVAGAELASLKPSESFNVFDHSFASNDVTYREASKATTVSSLKSDKVVGGYYAVMSKSDDAWVAIPKVKLDKRLTTVTARVATNGSGGTIVLALDSPRGEKIATINVPATAQSTYNWDGVSLYANELGYADVTAALEMRKIDGKRDHARGYDRWREWDRPNHAAWRDFDDDKERTLYVLFTSSDLRIESLQME